eukprot:CAMPEP_0175082998 /NCGR_PEP_ID=MMETSP0052_2-20121109/27089_1 /TAXON_ID=51329 ORGANISM="Polytomella parva, Strain SAG 63-3" /NCGR_SAMPLE_ID=MMETSP0052_2 /ASSEMBLY_ACC=CAM_ASM_000194 /LENGTH=255 /DNA_ID=CAMNT_0016354301 /DNA_START=28 /DNA_END=792 /DNA_ORIENTATION=+
MSPLTKATELDKVNMFEKYEAFLFDLDGTVWKGNHVIPGVTDVLELLRYHKKKVFFVTNNATKARSANIERLSSFGIISNESEMYTSAFAAVLHLQSLNFKRKVYVIGEVGLVQELRAAGFEVIGGHEHAGLKFDFTNKQKEPSVDIDREIGAVIVGLDREISYFKVQYALTCLLEIPDCLFIACNEDQRGHFSQDQEWAAAGTMVAMVKFCSGRTPHVVGKPSSLILKHVCSSNQLSPNQCLIVGDRLDTDILW